MPNDYGDDLYAHVVLFRCMKHMELLLSDDFRQLERIIKKLKTHDGRKLAWAIIHPQEKKSKKILSEMRHQMKLISQLSGYPSAKK